MKKGWEIKKFSEIGKVYNGNSINEKVKKDNYSDLKDGFPFIATKDISYESEINYDNGIKIPFVEKSSFKTAPKNTVLICAEGGSAGRKIGFTNQEVCFGNKLFALATNKNVESRFIFYYYFSATFQENFAIELAGIIGGVSMNKFKNFEIPLPPLPEQQRIVTILDAAFTAIAKAKTHAEQNLKNAKELFESYLQGVFENKGKMSESGFIGLKDEQDLKGNKKKILKSSNLENPDSDKGEGWEEKCLEDLVDEKCTLSYGIVQPGEEYSDGLPVIRPTDLTSKFIAIKGLKLIDPKLAEGYKSTKLIGGELLLCVRGSTGILSIASKELAGANVTRGIVPIRFNSKIINQEYGYYLLISNCIQKQIKAKTYGAALMQINIGDLRKILTPYPSIKEQHSIVQKLDALSAETKKLETIYQTKLNDLEELKKSVLQKAFSGQLSESGFSGLKDKKDLSGSKKNRVNSKVM